MGALTPFFLVAALGIGVPLYLHLFQHQEASRIPFPALRYLQRTEREHARRIRLRQLLLLLLRVAVVLLLVGAGARLYLKGPGSAHPPTALAIVLDNSVSSGQVVGEERTLDRLKAVALRSLASANPEDRIWVLRVGEPWEPSVPGSAEDARRAVETTLPTAARGDLSLALAHAAELVRTAGLEAGEIHLLSDLQATAFGAAEPAGDVPVVVWAPEEAPQGNRGITRVLVGGGLPPLQGQRTEVAVEMSSAGTGDTIPVPVRVVIDERVRSAGAVPPGAAVALPLPSAPAGWVLGAVDADPDALRADDRRFFAFRARSAPGVHVFGDPGIFATEAMGVLEAAGRLRPTAPGLADAVVSVAGEGVEAVAAGGAVLVLPPADPTLLPGLNRRLAAAGIPWRYERAEGGGEVELQGLSVPEPLVGIRTRVWYRLSLAADPVAPSRTVALAGEDPWAVDGSDAAGRRYLLLASALDPESSDLPVSAQMVRFIDWFTGQWAASAGGAAERPAGEPLAAPRAAESVRLPSGAEVPVDGTRTVRATAEAGFYTFLRGDSVLAVEALNPPPSESDLTPLPRAELRERIGRNVSLVTRESAWDRTAFQARQGPELWRILLAAALLALLVEAAAAAAVPLIGGRGRRAPGEGARDAA